MKKLHQDLLDYAIAQNVDITQFNDEFVFSGVSKLKLSIKRLQGFVDDGLDKLACENIEQAIKYSGKPHGSANQ